jgi:hypothetical protein
MKISRRRECFNSTECEHLSYDAVRRPSLLCVCTHSKKMFNNLSVEDWFFPQWTFHSALGCTFSSRSIGNCFNVGKRRLANMKNPCEISAHSVSFRRFVRLVGFTTVADRKSRWIIELKSRKSYCEKKINHNSCTDLPEDKNLVENT